VKLLLDQNLSRRLVAALADLYADSTHVALSNLDRAGDAEVWEFARSEGLAIVTKDTDFHHLALLRGPPPKVISISLGNCQTAEVEQLLRDRVDDVVEFDEDRDSALLILP
jgi:predicted nuclease of predicted toxin-antitoxin system